jgi:hypothetical protein
MWWWWVFTFIHNCIWIFWFIAKNAKFLEIPKISFNGQLNMFFGKIFSCTCDLHLKLDILNPLNIIILSNGFKKKSFPLKPFLQNLKTSKFLYNLIFRQVHIMNIYFHKKGACFCCTIFLKSIVWLYAFVFIPFVEICNLDIWYSWFTRLKMTFT